MDKHSSALDPLDRHRIGCWYRHIRVGRGERECRCNLRLHRRRLGRIIRDVRRKIEGNTALEDRFGPLLDLAQRVCQ